MNGVEVQEFRDSWGLAVGSSEKTLRASRRSLKKSKRSLSNSRSQINSSIERIQRHDRNIASVRDSVVMLRYALTCFRWNKSDCI